MTSVHLLKKSLWPESKGRTDEVISVQLFLISQILTEINRDSLRNSINDIASVNLLKNSVHLCAIFFDFTDTHWDKPWLAEKFNKRYDLCASLKKTQCISVQLFLISQRLTEIYRDSQRNSIYDIASVNFLKKTQCISVQFKKFTWLYSLLWFHE